MKSLGISILFFLLTASLWAQENDTSSYKAENSPILGIGVNTIGFFGDLNDRDYNTPFGGNIGYDFYVIQPINDFLSLNFHLMTGKIQESERSLQRNINYSTKVFSGGLQLEYNFEHIMPENQIV